MIIYIASPYSSYDDKQAAVNVQIDAFAALRDAGHQPIAPLLSHYIDERHPASYERWMQWCMTMVSVADLVVRLPGESKGADAEVAEARRRGIPVVYGVESIGAQIRQDYTWAEHQAANQATLDEMAAFVGLQR